MANPPIMIRVGHSPDPDDAFMFYALAKGKIDTGPYRFTHEMADIETLNRLDSDAERRTTLQQGGIAPPPAILFPSPDPDCTGDACRQPPLTCVGVECFSPGFENNPVRTLWTQDGIE